MASESLFVVFPGLSSYHSSVQSPANITMSTHLRSCVWSAERATIHRCYLVLQYDAL